MLCGSSLVPGPALKSHSVSVDAVLGGTVGEVEGKGERGGEGMSPNIRAQ